jgi:hypothetical protein
MITTDKNVFPQGEFIFLETFMEEVGLELDATDNTRRGQQA